MPELNLTIESLCRWVLFWSNTYIYAWCCQALGPGFTQYAEPVFMRCINLIRTHEVAKVFLRCSSDLDVYFANIVERFSCSRRSTPVREKYPYISDLCPVDIGPRCGRKRRFIHSGLLLEPEFFVFKRLSESARFPILVLEVRIYTTRLLAASVQHPCWLCDPNVRSLN